MTKLSEAWAETLTAAMAKQMLDRRVMAAIAKACDDYRALRLASEAYDERRTAEGSVDARQRIARRKGEVA